MSFDVLGSDFLTALAMLLPVIWPFIYLRLKRSNKYFLFASTLVGMIFLTQLLLAVAAAPIFLFTVKIVPALAVNGSAIYILPILRLFELVATWHYIVLSLFLCVVLPPLLYRRYTQFA